MDLGAIDKIGGACDVLVVGGGIHGVGVAQAAAAAGYSTVLVERTGLAAGTSSRSSKLIHGGLRYLESAQFGLVRESLAERALLVELAPELVQLVPFHIPVYRDTSRRAWMVHTGLTLYATLGNLREAARFSRLPRREWGQLDGLKTDGLQAVFRYYDAHTDDAALTRAVAASAAQLGAHILCPASLVSAARKGGGYRVELDLGGEMVELRASTLVNAAGPWVNLVADRITPPPPRRSMDLIGGTHLELEGEVKLGIYYMEAPTDQRAVFTMPWKGHTLVGTTETPFEGDPATIEPTQAEIDYLLGVHAHYFPERERVLIDAWAGLRVLPHGKGNAFHRPREVALPVDRRDEPRLVSIYGGKLTGYRLTAEKVLEKLEGSLPKVKALADTRRLPLAPHT